MPKINLPLNTHEQLAELIDAVEHAGWVRLNGNTWQSPDKSHTLHTAYVYHEATLELRKATRWPSGKDWLRHYFYRGAEPLSWAATEADKILRKVLDAESA